MRVLLVNDRRNERDSLMKALSRTAYQLEAVEDESAAIAAMGRESAQVIVVAPPTKSGDELIRRLRSSDVSGQAYILAILDGSLPHKELAGLLAAGATDFLRRPVFDAELIERVKAPLRLMRWVRSVVKPMAFDLSAPTDVARLHAWQNLGSAVAEDLSQMVGENFSVTQGWPDSFGTRMRGATIAMSLPGDGLELRVSIVVDANGADWLRCALLGDPLATDAMADDALRELANTAGGALKRAALGESVTLTTGIPFNEKLTIAPNQSAWTLASVNGAARVVVVGEIHSKENQRVPATNLAEGMVVVQDIRTDGGLLLVPAGSRLTSSTAAKLAKVLGPRFFLEVAPAA